MAVPIADDWKAIRERMQEIETERVTKRQCPVCRGAGWMLEFSGVRFRGHVICNVCHNLDERPRPLQGGEKALGRTAYSSRR